ncbi:TrbG/VirB9 family P-type conjugative transfer protein [Aquibium sp. A9E412]|uniref:TrbG/VirB9 family P-type conjugative transfer protein n=1 Tax=Aquibium sp. A9E412 TaxID=2976767 RepID=UPI0025B233DE|nr:TrbG/VirB9 family P-type conjugative transfer protein [Aquibium sp. A9E412]MDN2565888.1 TrbG/VirB9 family P-type conjugative transfer protein [Aquibium sp. A9E412]
MAVTSDQGGELLGFSVPVHRALTEPILLGGAPRAIAIMNGTLAGAVGLGLRLWLVGIAIWAIGHVAAVWAAKRDPLFAEVARHHRYGLQGDRPPWRPVSVFDDGRRVYIVFPVGIVQGEMPPLFVLGWDGEPEIVNSRIYRNILIVDRIFAAAELRLGSEDRQQTVRIVRTDGRPGS